MPLCHNLWVALCHNLWVSWVRYDEWRPFVSPIQSRVLPLSPSLCYITILCQTRWHYTYLIQHLHYSIDQVIRKNQTCLQPPDVWPRVNCIVCSHNRSAHTLLDYHMLTWPSLTSWYCTIYTTEKTSSLHSCPLPNLHFSLYLCTYRSYTYE